MFFSWHLAQGCIKVVLMSSSVWNYEDDVLCRAITRSFGNLAEVIMFLMYPC